MLLKFTFLCLLAASATALHFPTHRNQTNTPVFPSSYSVEGTILLPYAEIKEPFTAYYDQAAKKSRIDYYGDLVLTYQRADKIIDSVQGVNYKFAFMPDVSGNPQRVCFQQNGSLEVKVETQNVLPDLTSFTFKGQTACPSIRGTFDDKVCELWENINVVGGKVNKYAFWLFRQNVVEPVPVAYLMKGYDTLLGSHFDKYEIHYQNYRSGPIDPSVFEIDSVFNITCRGFPGPGAEENAFHNPMKEFLHPEKMEESFNQQFTDFKRDHAKSYVSDNHERHASTQFRQNLRFINSQNRRNLHYKMAVNHLADKHESELRHLRGRLYTPGYNGGLPFNKDLSLSSGPLPESLDWRLLGAVTPVKDQAICGSCWSFGTTGTLEGQYFAKTGRLVSLSQQELMDCSWGQGNNACDGGEDFRAYEYIVKAGGIATEDDYGPYLGQDGKCSDKDLKKTVKITGFVNVTSYDEDALRIALFRNGPVSIGIDASHKSLSFYANGVYYEPKCGNKPDQLDHAVLAVGYGTLYGQDYWLVKNSWSTYWGNDGYVLMAVKDNNCGVMTSPTFPLIN